MAFFGACAPFGGRDGSGEEDKTRVWRGRASIPLGCQRGEKEKRGEGAFSPPTPNWMSGHQSLESQGRTYTYIREGNSIAFFRTPYVLHFLRRGSRDILGNILIYLNNKKNRGIAGGGSRRIGDGRDGESLNDAKTAWRYLFLPKTARIIITGGARRGDRMQEPAFGMYRRGGKGGLLTTLTRDRETFT